MKRALVTGGSGAIGSAIAAQLAADGHHVYVHANSGAARADAVVAQIRGAGGSAEPIVFDVSDGPATEATLTRLPGMRREQWSRVIDVSLNGFFNVTQPLLMPMIATRWGRIVNISSVSAVVGNRGQTNYAAAKAGLHGATRSLSLELASRGITVNTVAPGVIASPMSDEAFTKDIIDRLVPMKRAGKPEEVAALVSFLASDRAAYISGQLISINGGMI